MGKLHGGSRRSCRPIFLQGDPEIELGEMVLLLNGGLMTADTLIDENVKQRVLDDTLNLSGSETTTLDSSGTLTSSLFHLFKLQFSSQSLHRSQQQGGAHKAKSRLLRSSGRSMPCVSGLLCSGEDFCLLLANPRA